MSDKNNGDPLVAILLPNMRSGGAERVALNLANRFSKMGINVDLVLMNACGELLPELSDGIRIVDLSAQRMRGVFLPLLRYLKARRPMALLVMMWPLTVIAISAAMFCPKSLRVVVSDHNALSRSTASTNGLRRWLLKHSIRWLYPKAAAVVVVSQGVADDMVQLTGLQTDSITKIYNPVSRGALPAPLSTNDTVGGWRHPGHKHVITVGTLKPQKDHNTLLMAFSKLRKNIPAKLLILGDGPLRSFVLSRAEQLGISDDVFLHGFVRDPYPFYLASDLFVLSSAYEGFGNVLVEALECGLSVVSTDCIAGPREILADGKFGQLVPVNDPESLASAMEAALSEPVDKEALKSRARHFSIERSADQYLKLLLPIRQEEPRV